MQEGHGYIVVYLGCILKSLVAETPLSVLSAGDALVAVEHLGDLLPAGVRGRGLLAVALLYQ